MVETICVLRADGCGAPGGANTSNDGHRFSVLVILEITQQPSCRQFTLRATTVI